MARKETVKISVKNLIDVCLKTGDLSNGYVSRTRALDGIREHTRIQSLRPDHYKKEVRISLLKKHPDFNIEIFGRIDGIFESEDILTLEEIKTCVKDPDLPARDPSPAHLAQLKCYGYMILKQRKLDQIDLQLTYVQLNSKKTAEHKNRYTEIDLESFFNDLISTYISRLKIQHNWAQIRNKSINSMPFPYKTFRKGQRSLAESVYKIIKNNKILFAKAPTGTGKTIATLFPAVKSLGLKQIDKIFYLTSKTIGRTVAVKALDDMRNSGLRLKTIVLTAKQKICFTPDETCDMEACSYAHGYYDKLKTAMAEIYKHDAFDQTRIETLGQMYHICPFELSLDISLLCEVIICDLNYCFDPRVYLRRYFDHSATKCTFLIDEAHNLPDRLRSMYSAHLIKTDVLKTQRLVRDMLPDISKSLIKINRDLLGMKKECVQKKAPFLSFDNIPEDFITKLKQFAVKTDRWLDQNKESPIRSELLDFYFTVSIFLTTAAYFDSNYKFYIERIKENDLCVRLFCMDPSPIFSSLIKRSLSSVLFSATLFPISYYQDILFEDSTAPFSTVLPCCFPRENANVLIYSPIKTTFKERSRYYTDVADTIETVIRIRKGNYMVYFPSYHYMNTVVDLFEHKNPLSTIIVQTPHMTENERQAFLNTFSNSQPVTGFAVMGGIFGEGIDLTGEQLIGAIVVSAGIPQICPERDLIKAYYDNADGSGFYKSYQMPGFNRVMQAAGRVIRTQSDKGIILLIDNRFTRQDYQSLFPYEWQEYSIVHSLPALDKKIKKFWNRHP